MALIGTTLCQYVNYDPRAATNYQTADSARQESVDQEGTVNGQYSYIDPNGKTISVKYTAGKEGFKVIGDHLPVAPQVHSVQSQQPLYKPQSYHEPTYQPASYQRPIYEQQFHQQSIQQQSFQQPTYQQPSYQQPAYQNFNHLPQPQSYQQHLQTQAPVPYQPQKSLFAPAQNPYPAASAGQIQNYQKALEEEREEAQKALTQNEHRFGFPAGAPEGIPQNPYNIQYGADNGYSFEYNL